ncbi:hypothetical protein IV498_16805 [Paenarthrobacter sp. Z7-10]|uniref:hypothetical protein n=1 Tax=Paenarthrobacter sp. Z7-10 TaxID=2787635 RepID=UPI0022A8F612|nr:hypothetical protein [Paenarthrobacter sp. Z7-10]MCZ2404788.1 hypothetical protein [Paenarthrobacter sp. Z7-10]
MTLVLSSSEASDELAEALERFRAQGLTAEPVVFGADGVPEAAVISFTLYSALLPAIDELVIAETLRSRSGKQSVPPKEVAADAGLNPDD